jgi:hypothetical protein
MQKRSDWNYNGYTWVHQDGRRLTRSADYKPRTEKRTSLQARKHASVQA